MLRYSNPSDSLRFGSLFVGVSREISIPIQNRGSSPLVISAISSSAPQFVPTPSAITVAPRQGITLRVLFTPSSAGSFTGNLRIVSNDPDSPQIDIGLSGQGALPPIVGTTPDSLFASVNEGDGVTQTLRIANAGPSPLDYTISIAARSSSAVLTPFAGLAPQSISSTSNNPPNPPRPTTDGASASATPEPRFHALAAEFESLAPSPETMTCVVEDPASGTIFAQANSRPPSIATARP